MVHLESLLGIANDAEYPVLDVRAPADVVDHLVVDRVLKQAVDRKVAPLRVLLGRREPYLAGPAAVLVLAVGAERRDLDDARAVPHEHDAERRADRLRLREQLAHARRRGV